MEKAGQQEDMAKESKICDPFDKEVKCWQKIDTLLNADTVEFCPFPNLNPILLCGTYKLKECSTDSKNSQTSETSDAAPETKLTPPDQQTRLGGVQVLQVQHHEEDLSLKQITSLDMCGVLDIKWPKTPPSQRTIFGLVDAEGNLQILQLNEKQTALDPVAKGRLSDSSLGLSLEWHSCDQGNSHHIVCSDSAGCVTVFDFGEGLNVLSQWLAHDFEAWITAFNQWDKNIVYSGGDDCVLKKWDLRDTSRPALVSRRHQMGVCSIQSHPLDENIFASGSYDEQLFVWDRRSPKHPLTETSLGGGVWRIKWEPNKGNHILTATMYNGTHIVDCHDLGINPLPIFTHYNDHNLAYGADWCHLSKQSLFSGGGNSYQTGDTMCAESFIISTCSFYDHSLHLWEWNT